MMEDSEGTAPPKGRASRRWRSIVAVLGLLATGVAAWGGVVAYVGPTFDFDMGTTTRAWVWTQSHTTLHLAPALAGIVGGLLLAAAARRGVARLGALLVLASGIWFTLGPTLQPLWQKTGVSTLGTAGTSGSTLERVLEGVGYHFGTGIVLIAIGSFALGLLVPAHAEQVAAQNTAPEPQPLTFQSPTHA